MATTRKELRRQVGNALGALTLGTVQTASTATLTDPTLIDRATTETEYVRNFCLLASGAHAGQVRRVVSFDPDSGQLTMAREWGVPAYGDEYELHALVHPDVIHRAINSALGACTRIARATLSPILSGSREYELPSIISRPSQVVNVHWGYGEEPETREWPLAWYAITPNPDLILRLRLRPVAPSAADRLIVTYIAPYLPLETDEAECWCPAEWAVAGALVDVYAHIASRATSEDVRRYEKLQYKAAKTFRRLSLAHAPRPARRVQLPEEGL